MQRFLARLALALVCSLAMAPHLAAQSGPGLPSRTYAANELFTIVATLGTGNHGVAFVHNGYLGTLRTGTGASFYDVSNPYAPVLVTSISGMGLSEPHTLAQTTAYGGKHLVVMRGTGLGGRGFGIWDVTNLGSPSQVVAYDIPGVPGGYATGLFWIFAQGRYLYCPAGSLGLFIVDTITPGSPVVVNQVPKSALGAFNTVLAFAIGNMLVLANSDGGSGFALLDIADPVHPVLVHSEPNTPIPYSLQVNGGRLLIAAVSGCIGCSGGNNGTFHLRGIGPTSFPPLATTGLPSRGGSTTAQDQFAHVAASQAYVKLDLSQPQLPVVGQMANPSAGGDFDWVTPLGNLVALGDDQGGATKLVPHQTLPDTTGPVVTMVVPADGAVQQAVTSRIGITMSDMVELDSLSATTFLVRPIGGQPLAGTFCHQSGIVNFSPNAPLAPNTTYEVVLPAGGVRDWSGNPTPSGFLSTFSTGPTINAINILAQPLAPVSLGQIVSFDVALVTGPGPMQFSWSFGDGSPPTSPSPASQASHAYAAAGHYSVRVTVTNGSVSGSHAQVQTVHHPITAGSPTHSRTIVLDEPGNRVWCVNPDNDSVAAIYLPTMQLAFELPAGDNPRTLAKAPDGTIWVVSQDDAVVHVFHGVLPFQLAAIQLPPGAAPYGIAMSPNGAFAYVTLRARGEVARLSITARTLVDTVAVGPQPKGIAVTADAQRLLVTRFVSGPATGPQPVAEVYELAAQPFGPLATRTLALDPGPDTENSGRGLPNYLSSLAISPDGRRAWLPSKKDNLVRGAWRSGQPLTFESTVRTIASQLDLLTNQEDLASRIDFNDRDMAFAVEFSALGDYAFLALQGSNAIDVRDAYTGQLVAGVDDTGLAPQGLALSADGQRLYVHNFLSRTIAAYDVRGVTGSTDFRFVPLATAATVFVERLPATVLRGKQIFYNAADPRMSEDGYLSCASCHLDGEQDGAVWDFTDRGEGLRNTVSLLGRRGLGHGRVHWTANFDEIQDFENDIRNAFGGTGFLTTAQWQSGTVSNPLGQPKAGLSADLDALAAYVASLSTFGRSPHRAGNGALSAAAERGHALFSSLACAVCHAGPGFTDSRRGARHDVGTISPGSGQASGGPLLGFDTPTLRGLWATAPYLHDGSAPTLLDVLDARNPLGLHGASNALPMAQKQDLVQYLLAIDDGDPGCRLPGTGEDLQLRTGVGGAVPDGHCLAEAVAGQTVRQVMDSVGGTFHGAIAGLLYQVHGPGAVPLPTFAGLHLDRVDGAQLALPLQPGGFLVDLVIPAGLHGAILRTQAVALSPQAQNGIYAASGAHDVFLW